MNLSELKKRWQKSFLAKQALSSRISNSHFGYTKGYVAVQSPDKWFLLIKNYTAEITFEAAPVLFGNSMGMFPENISATSKRTDDEMAEEDNY